MFIQLPLRPHPRCRFQACKIAVKHDAAVTDRRITHLRLALATPPDETVNRQIEPVGTSGCVFGYVLDASLIVVTRLLLPVSCSHLVDAVTKAFDGERRASLREASLENLDFWVPLIQGDLTGVVLGVTAWCVFLRSAGEGQRDPLKFTPRCRRLAPCCPLSRD